MSTASLIPAIDADEISFGEIRDRLASRWLMIVGSGVIAALAGIGLAFLVKPVYRAEVLMLAVTGEGANANLGGSLSGQLGGLASLAGVSVGQDSERKVEALATLQSRALTEAFIAEQNLLPILFADRVDPVTAKWKESGVGKSVPTLWDGNELFNREIRFVDEDKKTGLITVAVEWTDPQLAAKWVTELVARTNALLRARAIERAESNIHYVQTQLQSASIVEVRQALYHLIETQFKMIMLARSSENYAFNVIDPAVVPEEKVRPRRALIASLFLIAGLMLAALYALINPKEKGTA